MVTDAAGPKDIKPGTMIKDGDEDKGGQRVAPSLHDLNVVLHTSDRGGGHIPVPGGHRRERAAGRPPPARDASPHAGAPVGRARARAGTPAGAASPRMPSMVRAVLSRVRALRGLLLVGAAVGLLALVLHLGTGPILSALTRVTWGQFVLICLVHGLSVVTDTLGWRYTLTSPPPFPRLLVVRCAGEAVNTITALGSVGGEALKAWLLRREVSYEASVPSLILAKSALVVAQTLLLVVGIAVASTAARVDPALVAAMGSLLLVEVVCVGGFLAVQVAGVIGRAGRVLGWVGIQGIAQAEQLDEALRGFYRREWRRFLLSVGCCFAGWLIGVAEALLILASLGLSGSLAAATVIEALGSGVRFATFFVPANLGPLEGANAAVFGALGFGAWAGLAFTLVRRARQAVWIGLGVVCLVAMRPTRRPGPEPRAVRSRRRRAGGRTSCPASSPR
jgi:uncharacterized protein (TIRG00374 family)